MTIVETPGFERSRRGVLAGRDRLYLLLAYAKSQQEDLTPAQLKVLRRLVGEVKAS